jgi:hypothetical protein
MPTQVNFADIAPNTSGFVVGDKTDFYAIDSNLNPLKDYFISRLNIES